MSSIAMSPRLPFPRTDCIRIRYGCAVWGMSRDRSCQILPWSPLMVSLVVVCVEQVPSWEFFVSSWSSTTVCCLATLYECHTKQYNTFYKVCFRSLGMNIIWRVLPFCLTLRYKVNDYTVHVLSRRAFWQYLRYPLVASYNNGVHWRPNEC